MSAPACAALMKTPRQNRMRRWGVVALRIALLVWVGLGVIVFVIQDSYIFPGAATQGQRDAMLTQGSNNELLSLRAADGTRIAALFGKALSSDGQPLADSRKCPTVIFFYGNGACLAYSTDIFDRVRRLGANIIIPEYEGYGMSGGKPSESGCYAAADAAYDYLLGRDDIDPKRIVPMGWSLGAAVAVDLASRRPAAGLVTISAFTNLRDMAHRFVPWLPMSMILKYRFDNLGKLGGITCPTFIAHGTRDELISPRMAGRLAAAAKGKVTRYDVVDAGHNDVFDVGGEELWNRVGEFVGRL
ncbi:MAG: alpha/beta hydrolase [Tepidisphaeraceae bacterium]